MDTHSNTILSLPDELIYFKNIISNKDDPIEKYTFALKEIIYIMKRLTKISVSEKDYYDAQYCDDENSLAMLLSKAYIRSYKDIAYDFEYIKKFILIFYDYRKAIYDSNLIDEICIYPKLDIRCFIKQSIFQADTNMFYFDEKTLNKLISIFVNFTKDEYSDCDRDIELLFEGLNYPSLILANIDLYEKGYISLRSDLDQITISLNKDIRNQEKIIFSRDRGFLKSSILDFINYDEKTKYSLKDFL